MTTVDTSASAAASAAAASSTSKSTAAKATLGTNFNTFLNMLTTQLKHQDPLSPMDSTQFTNQLVQFSSVEQQINANSNLEKLISLQTATQTAQAIAYVGQTVEVAGSTLPMQGGTAPFSYTLDGNASSVEIQIKNSSGNVVFKTNGDTASGRHDLKWDGTNSSGEAQGDGLYTIAVVAKDKEGKAMAASTTVTGLVTKLTNDATNGATLELGAGDKGAKITVTPDKVLSVVSDTTLASSQMAAANAQYQAAMAALQAAQSNTSSSSSTTTAQ
ncbi:flagellar hook capping protein [Paramagnetospirillum marisnigri]|uniref:Basal-body rod modification protein FlgD n=1 Tax=Paramagnetospirillum marisnigri TaxID=1285242 RepID=A0A178MHI9_9PROT|nr:flagellar hook assembly protein FlgD [Paramagnetospirillum marisnigri]OAN48181.1 flagellar hook capping protein [Paramagnetospirillum marisnigri]